MLGVHETGQSWARIVCNDARARQGGIEHAADSSWPCRHVHFGGSMLELAALGAASGGLATSVAKTGGAARASAIAFAVAAASAAATAPTSME
eukprot:5540149-Pleurochrysis_carterae.AAC.3